MHRIHLVGAWSGIAFLVILLVGFMPLANFVPAHSPAASAADIALIYQNNLWGIRLGAALMIFATAFYLPWTATIAEFIRQIDGDHSFLKTCTLLGGATASLFFLIPGLFYELAAFRPDRLPEITRTLNDMAWIFLLTPLPPFLVQALSMGVAILKDKRTTPLIPRWVGYLCIWDAVLLFPVLTAFFFKTGPFAWDGLFPFWIPLVMFTLWILIPSIYMVKALKHA